MADEDVTDESGGGEGLQQQGPGPSTSTINSSNNTTPSGYNTMPGGYPINNIPSPPGNGGSYLEEEVGLDEDGDVTVSLPKALIVTGVDSAIFEDVDAKVSNCYFSFLTTVLLGNSRLSWHYIDVNKVGV